MRVYGPSNIPGYGPNNADRTNKDGQRKGGQGQGEDQPPKQPPHEEDQVQLHAPDPAKPGAVIPIVPMKPAKPGGAGGKAPLDLSA